MTCENFVVDRFWVTVTWAPLENICNVNKIGPEVNFFSKSALVQDQ